MTQHQRITSCLWFDNQTEEEVGFHMAISFRVDCETQEEVDWERPFPECCSRGPDHEKPQRVMAALLQMKKLDIDALKRTYAG